MNDGRCLGFGLLCRAGIEQRRVVDHALLGEGFEFIGKSLGAQGGIGVPLGLVPSKNTWHSSLPPNGRKKRV